MTLGWRRWGSAVGLGAALQALAVQRACTVARAAGLPAETFVSLNVSPRYLSDPMMTAALGHAQFERLVIEVTEEEAVADYGALRAAIAPYLARGARLAVDDAGAGYASMRHVTELRPAFLKLDALLVRGLGDDAARQALVDALVGFAGAVGAIPIAEGAETSRRSHPPGSHPGPARGAGLRARPPRTATAGGGVSVTLRGKPSATASRGRGPPVPAVMVARMRGCPGRRRQAPGYRQRPATRAGGLVRVLTSLRYHPVGVQRYRFLQDSSRELRRREERSVAPKRLPQVLGRGDDGRLGHPIVRCGTGRWNRARPHGRSGASPRFVPPA